VLNHHVANDQNELGDAGTSEAVRGAIASWASLATTAVDALENGDPHVLGQAMNEAQASYRSALADRLRELHAPRLQEICGMLTGSLDALGAKFSGAGGDGSVIAIFATEQEAQRATKVLNREADLSAWLSPVS
jgi:mevalonate kinase